MITKRNILFSKGPIAKDLLGSKKEMFKTVLYEMAKAPETFSTLRFVVNDDGDSVALSAEDCFKPLINGVRESILLVSFLRVIGKGHHGKPSNVFSEENPQGFLLVNSNEAVDCFLARCIAEDPSQKAISVNDILPLKG